MAISARSLEPPDDPMRILKHDGRRHRRDAIVLEPPDDPMRILKPQIGQGMDGGIELEPPDDPMRILKHECPACKGTGKRP